jgi:hypothetical protein
MWLWRGAGFLETHALKVAMLATSAPAARRVGMVELSSWTATEWDMLPPRIKDRLETISSGIPKSRSKESWVVS